MKKLFLLFLLTPMMSFGQTISDQVIKSNIDEVKLYLTAGQMIHNQQVKLKPGRNKLKFSGVSAYADPASIQFKGDGSYRLVSVSTEMDFLAAEEFNPQISVLKDSLEVLKDVLQNVNDELGAYYAEQGVLNSNKSLGGKNQNLSVTQIKEAADFYHTRTLKINKALSRLKKEKRNLDAKIENTRFQLVELNYNENQRSNQVIVLVDCDSDVTMSSSLKYLVSDCGWAATYDLSAQDINQKINLKYKAQVYNNTGNAWKNVKLTLSTGDPKLSAAHPELSPWYLNYSQVAMLSQTKYYKPQATQEDYRDDVISSINVANQRAYDNYYMGSDQAIMENNFQRNSAKLVSNKNVGNQDVQMRNIDISELTTEFDIENKFTCPTDAKPYIVSVKEMDLDAKFSHITVPKLDRSAFLMANIVGWQELELIPGPTNVYFGGVYVGVSQIDTRNVSDTLSLSFGRDNKVIVMRKLKKEMSSKKVLGNFRKDSYLYDIAIRNNRSIPINIEVYDQVPISKNSDITVYVDEISEGSNDIETGEVSWKMNVSSGEVQNREIGYTVKYPKNSNITIQRFRTVSCPSF